MTSFSASDVRPLYIGGEWTPGRGGNEPMPTYNPTTGEEIARVTAATAQDVDDTVIAAQKGAAEWRALPWTGRAAVLREMAKRIRDEVDRLCLIDVENAGLPISASRRDVLRAADEIEYFAGIAGEVKGDTIPAPEGGLAYTLREPYGVVGRIIPFNHPFNFSAAKVAAPLAAGNAVILKAPDQAPLGALALAELVGDLFPAGVLNVLTGTGAEVGNAISSHPKIPRIGFIGSVPAGQAVMRAGAEHIKHVTLELGGKNPMIICEDMDPKLAAKEAVNGMNMRKTMGQSCQSNSRVFVHESIADEFIKELDQIVRAITIGDPRNEETEMGPVAFKAHYDRVRTHIDQAHEDGARLVYDGEKPEGFSDGYFVGPTVFDGVTPDMRLFHNEVFGPVMAVVRWSDENEMIEQINAVEFGLTARIWTNDLSRANRIVSKVDAGFVWINESGRKDRGIPVGGFKLSGLGKESCVEEIVSYTREKSVTTTFVAHA
ncbi:aldehyde dehydrogenase family protein [Leucobacter denitrificans]|uniref:Aldehyde dehydrogenase family protein n=1 Tax=Leucobacter denitrificans TaxID=683042 RepID=A0A7G9S318_9MICO|nr:aldehyde dehydrogenase family protein [Leucobacter denitrificans]QNN62243.1 aldehyde dehydrogenase family protein [Leucobacter denitrificans]